MEEENSDGREKSPSLGFDKKKCEKYNTFEFCILELLVDEPELMFML